MPWQTAEKLELEYFRSIKGEDFGKAVNKILAENLDSETLEGLQPKIDYHNGFYQDVKPGDRYSLTYVPGQDQSFPNKWLRILS